MGGDLSISLEESLSRDDPSKYTYRVQIIEEEADAAFDADSETETGPGGMDEETIEFGEACETGVGEVEEHIEESY